MYFMKKGICIIMLLLGVLLFCACVENVIPPDIDPLPGEDNTLQSSVRITLPDEGVPLYNNASVKVENTDLPLYFVYVNNEHTWGPNPDGRTGCGVGYFSLEGKAEISVAVSGMTSCVVRPLSACGSICWVPSSRMPLIYARFMVVSSLLYNLGCFFVPV